MKIALTSIFVENPGEAHEFYTSVLGFISKTFVPEANLAILASPEEPAGTRLMLEPNDNPFAKRFQQELFSSNIPVIGFSVDDIQSEYERLKEAGIVFRKPPTKVFYGTETIFEDGFGNLIQLLQR